jgi:hypothetical protein
MTVGAPAEVSPPAVAGPPPDLRVANRGVTHLSWTYASTAPRIRALYERGLTAQWNASTDIDWTLEVPFGEPLPPDSGWASAALANSPMARYGDARIDAFRWEFQGWMVSQFLHGEQGALVAAAKLVEALPDVDAKLYAANQAADEARHVEVFSRYLDQAVPHPYPVCAPLVSLLDQVLGDDDWDVMVLGVQVLLEGLATAAFRLAENTFHDPLIQRIATLVARDEARHVSFGSLALAGRYDGLTAAELAYREEFVLEAASLMRRRFLLEDIWGRLEIPLAEGVAFARADPLMIAYRQTLFAKVIATLSRAGLMTSKVRDGLAALDLLGPAGRRFASDAGARG